MRPLFLIPVVALLLLSMVLLAGQLVHGEYPLGLAQVLILASLLLQYRPVANYLGSKSKAFAYGCLVLATPVLIGAFWLRLQPDTPVRAGDPQEPAVRAANKATEEFHRAVSEQRYADVCRLSRRGAFSGVTGLRCEEFLAYLYARLGPFEGVAERGPILVETNASSPRVSLRTTSRYQKQDALENFEWLVRDESQDVTLTSYRINADALSP